MGGEFEQILNHVGRIIINQIPFNWLQIRVIFDIISYR